MEIYLIFIFIILYVILNEKSKFKIKIINNFLTDTEIETILNDCNNLFKRSEITYENDYIKEIKKLGIDPNIVYNYRKSSTCTLDYNTKSFEIIKKKVRKLGINPNTIENLQLTKYKKGEYYKRHYDYFHHKKYPENKTLLLNGQRLKTIFVYLKTPLLGGYTNFTKLNKKYRLDKGDALFWDNCEKYKNSYKYNLESEHEGTPIIKGEKIGLNIWINDKIQTNYKY